MNPWTMADDRKIRIALLIGAPVVAHFALEAFTESRLSLLNALVVAGIAACFALGVVKALTVWAFSRDVADHG